MKWWMWALIVIAVIIIAFAIWYFIEKKRAEKEGRDPESLKKKAQKVGVAAAAAGVIGAGSFGAVGRNEDGSVVARTDSQKSYYSSAVSAGEIDSTVTSFATVQKDGKRVVADGHYYGNKNSRIYMGPGTTVAKNLNPKNYVEFDSDAEASSAGFSPSKAYAKIHNGDVSSSTSSSSSK